MKIQNLSNHQCQIQLIKMQSDKENEEIVSLTSQQQKQPQKNQVIEYKLMLINLFVFLIFLLILRSFIKTFRQQKQNQLSKNLQVQIKCAKNHKIAYVWLGNNSIPQHYQAILKKCKDNSILLGDKQLNYYKNKWNQQFGTKIYLDFNSSYYNINDKSDLLKLLYLFYEGGVYADFDQVINQECWQDYNGSEILFTNYWNIDHQKYIPEQSFMKVNSKHNPQVGRMIIWEITKKIDRWAQCKTRQCEIRNCQVHLWNRLWTKVQGTTK